ncbi:terpenoid cyclases/Protein prenyltransferase [Hesseltinella vesiculosa]|uniref:Terpenoid cyclases/Protein prenyltransferase n=1 Tax=Hesseltinella vesiculosa TaxID=101127 RepID=A0A1X2GLF6_9FUNG|nr:terpenoid cyclases/Protein prenyltransferase [Hesseltinella vesiculosa]
MTDWSMAPSQTPRPPTDPLFPATTKPNDIHHFLAMGLCFLHPHLTQWKSLTSLAITKIYKDNIPAWSLSISTERYQRLHVDLSRWRLHVDQGAQTWYYLETDQQVQQEPPTDLPSLHRATTPQEAARNGFENYRHLQMKVSGLVSYSWADDHLYVTGTPVSEPMRLELIHYLLNRAHAEDGGWHFYRLWLLPVPPELWLLPKILPFCPGSWWVHCRLVYIPMGYLYAKRATALLTTFTQSLREELYVQPCDSIHWDQQRNNVCEADLYTPHTKMMDLLNKILTYYEILPLNRMVKTLEFLDMTQIKRNAPNQERCYRQQSKGA